MTDILLIVTVILLVVVIALLFIMARRSSQTDSSLLIGHLDSFEKAQERTERVVREEMAQSRDELGKAEREQRQELTDAFKTFGDSIAKQVATAASTQKDQLDAFSGQLSSFAKTSGERLDLVRAESAASAKQLREEVVATLTSISETISSTLKDMSAAEKSQLELFSGQIASLTKTSGEKLDSIRTESSTMARELREEVIAALNRITESNTRAMGELRVAQKDQLLSMSNTIGKLSDSIEKKLETVRTTVENKLNSIQGDNAKQLEQMRLTVDEKLQGTLEKRLGESFKQVSDRLELVHKGLGEMQTLATGVGDLKKVLTNVKTRGTWGEVQLGALLEQVFNPDQYAANVSPVGGGERVEFAIKLPGQGVDADDIVWLPIDAKFPIEDYQRLVDAQEIGDKNQVELAGNQLERRVISCAKDISNKYLHPPKTTDFGILFLPIEGLFAEVIRRTGLIDVIQREHRVVIAGPTTLWAIINSLQMGFRTLAIQKRSSEVWNTLAAVKTEWSKYGEILDVVQKKLNQASENIEKVKVRSRAVGRKLRDVQELPVGEAAALLPIDTIEEADATDDDTNIEPTNVET